MNPLRVTLLLCGAEVLGLGGIATFASLLPFFIDFWHLSNTQAGWLSAVYYAAYVVCVPTLTALTDRLDAKKILLFSLCIGFFASAGFGWGASGFWSALALRFLSGVSLAGIYMPGLKLLSDHVGGPRQSRFVSFYTASFSLGTSLSYFMAGEISLRMGWRWAFLLAGFLNLAGMVLVWLWVPSGLKIRAGTGHRRYAGIVAVFRNRWAMAYILAYAAHMWELFGLRSWMVAFLEYSRQLQPLSVMVLSPTQVVALINLIGLPASIAGNELCQRFGRKKILTWIMMTSFAMSLIMGFSTALPYALVVVLGLIYGVFVLGDSASLTAGAVMHASPESRGATLAVHSTLGFGAAFLGPLGIGMILDLFAGRPGIGWGAGFALMGAGCALGPLVLHRFLAKPGGQDV